MWGKRPVGVIQYDGRIIVGLIFMNSMILSMDKGDYVETNEEEGSEAS